MWWLVFSAMAFAQVDGSTVVCPKGQFSELGDIPKLRFLSNKSHILVCGKEGHTKKNSFFLNEFEVYYYHPVKKRLMPNIMYTLPNQKFRIYSKGRSLFFEELVYTGAKRVPGFQNSVLCANDGDCAFATVECIFNIKKYPKKTLVGTLRDRLEKAHCL